MFGIANIGCLALSGYNADIGNLLCAFHVFNFQFWINCNLFGCLIPNHCGAGWPFYALLAAASGQLAWQIFTVDLSSRADCNRKYVSDLIWRILYQAPLKQIKILLILWLNACILNLGV